MQLACQVIDKSEMLVLISILVDIFHLRKHVSHCPRWLTAYRRVAWWQVTKLGRKWKTCAT